MTSPYAVPLEQLEGGSRVAAEQQGSTQSEPVPVGLPWHGVPPVADGGPADDGD